MSGAPLKLAVVAGEGLRRLARRRSRRGTEAARCDGTVELIERRWRRWKRRAYSSLFDYSELSIMGFAQVIKRLPKLLARIRQTADAIIRGQA